MTQGTIMTQSAPSGPLEGDARTTAQRNANACQQMADLCGELLALAPELSPREFLRSLAALVAGIDLGLKGFQQLARGGANGLAGAGFRAEYDDGTVGQARHFAGTAAGAALLGEKPAELLAHHLVDPAESIDGQLSTAALAFAQALIAGDLPLDQAGSWIETHICDPDFTPDPNITPFDVLDDPAQAARTIRARFSDTEWRALTELPQQIAVAAALSDPSGDLDDARDLIAGIRQLATADQHPSALVQAVAAERAMDGIELGSDDTRPAERVEQIERSTAAHLRLLRERGMVSTDIEAYASLLLTVAHAAVRGSKSGGFLGIGGQTVSDREASFLDRLEGILEANLAGCERCLE